MAKRAKATETQSTARKSPAKKKGVKKAAPKPRTKIAETPVWAKETRYPAKFLR